MYNIHTDNQKMETALVNVESKPHVLFIPFPAQSHIKCMLKLARILHHKGLHITFVNTVYNHQRFLKSGGPDCVEGAPGFQFETIPDGLPYDPDNVDATQDLNEVCKSVLTNCLAPFLDLVGRLEIPVTCIISDGFMPFTVDAAEKLRVPIMYFWTLAASAFMGFYQAPNLVEKGLIPLKDESCFTNGYLDTVIDWVPGLEGFRLKDFPGYARTTNPNETGFIYCLESVKATRKVSHIILHTFEELESNVIKALKPTYPNVYTIGPLQLHINQITDVEETKKLDMNGYSLWKEENECLEWLQSKEPNSVVYVNFGSITVMSLQELLEFGWGLANSKFDFLWIIRPDLLIGESSVLPQEFKEAIEKRGFIASWCPQEKVLNHPSIGVFLTHCGWGSTIESLSAGVPMICWPFYADQFTNSRQMCKKWEVGIEIGSNVNRVEVEKLVSELTGGVEGKRLKKNAMEWKRMTEIATSPNGSSSLNVEKLVNDIKTFSRD